jgi:hypothetical protein
MSVKREGNCSNPGHEASPRPTLVSELRRGNIFDSVQGPGPRLTIVFGHVGYNEMGPSWQAFRDSNPSLRDIGDPFESAASPLHVGSNAWLWFVPAGVNYGMADADLLARLDAILEWAKERSIRFVVTNGIRDVDHSTDKSANRASDDRRTAMLTKYLAERERVDRLQVALVSLNDVFVRYWATRTQGGGHVGRG